MFAFMYDLQDWSLFLVCICIVGLTAFAAALFMAAVRLAWPNRQKTSMVNTMLSGILLPTGLVIAFVASDVWQQETRGRTAVEQEAIAVADVLRTAQHLPAELRDQVVGLTNDYIRDVVESEWPLMARGGSSAKAESLLDALEQTSVQVDVQAREAGADRVGMAQAAKDLRRYAQQVESARNQRLLVATSRVMPTKWAAVMVLLFVAACVIYELHATQRRPLVLSMALFSLGFGATLYLIASYDRPFTGATIIEPESMTLMQMRG
ncbi:DUF4239 domain-containing protein [uncultured Castellaniella sp.]|uniref:bestrophin-like domain n=1 Tax=uncultured Castellaniella sp. TaxID=647907 RepID=UPI0026080675|nr:DUF4239 domain-containing protein [uncultured Castellaniella sp.]